MAKRSTPDIARIVLSAFEKFTSDFHRVTCRARRRFETMNWRGRYRDAVARLDLYETALQAVNQQLTTSLGKRRHNRLAWIGAKDIFAGLINGRHDADRAETFFNSVTRKVFWTIGIDRELEFFGYDDPSCPIQPCDAILSTYTRTGPTSELIRKVLTDFQFRVPFRDIEEDSMLVANEIDLRIWTLSRYGSFDRIDMVCTPFFRNKVAYLVGSIRVGRQVVPLVLPLYNSREGLFVDTVLLTEAEVSRVFSFAFSYFHVDVSRYDLLIAFLQRILPNKPLAELYISVGLNRHGKTVLYGDLHRYVHVTREKFVIAPGKEGAMMIGFTLPGYKFVLKIIKDRPCFLRTPEVTPKTTTRDRVMEQYDFVRHRDRVGRMVDTQEFENLRFRKRRFSLPLLKEFARAATQAVTFDGEYIVLNHVYIQRKVTPLPMYLLQETDSEAVRKVIIDFGYFLKDLAAVGIFPSDLFNIWNYGVTRRGRVVLFDYDDLEPLENVRFSEKPKPRDEIEELQLDEDRVTALASEYFMDEVERFSGVPRPLKGVFMAHHADLYTVDFWHDISRRVKRGEVIDITPYDRTAKFRQSEP